MARGFINGDDVTSTAAPVYRDTQGLCFARPEPQATCAATALLQAQDYAATFGNNSPALPVRRWCNALL